MWDFFSGGGREFTQSHNTQVGIGSQAKNGNCVKKEVAQTLKYRIGHAATRVSV
jgi:hypothetical protein